MNLLRKVVKNIYLYYLTNSWFINFEIRTGFKRLRINKILYKIDNYKQEEASTI